MKKLSNTEAELKKALLIKKCVFYQTDKNSHRICFIKNVVLKNFAIFTGKHLCWILFFNFTKKRVQYSNTYFEGHLRVAASELTLENDCLELGFLTVTFKTISTQ